jgi:hypothetical protein
MQNNLFIKIILLLNLLNYLLIKNLVIELVKLFACYIELVKLFV